MDRKIIGEGLYGDNISEKQIKLLNPIALAYIGDCVYELYIRQYILNYTEDRRSKSLHKLSIKLANAKAQSGFLEEIQNILLEEELDIIRRGRNCKTGHIPKSASVIDYKRATALEALIGYLYLLKRIDRIDIIMKTIFEKTNFN